MEKTQYKTLKEWRKDDPVAYKTAKRRGFLDELCERFGWEINKSVENISLIDKRCILKICLEYHTKKNWKSKSPKTYNLAIENGWVVECEEVLEKAFREWESEIYMKL